MTLKEFASKYKSRADCAAALGVKVGNLNVLINRERDFVQLASGKWMIISNDHKTFSVTLPHCEACYNDCRLDP